MAATINMYIVETKNATYHYRCPHSSPKVGKLIEGEYVIDVEPRCVLDTAYWNLQGLPMLRYTRNVTVEAPVVILSG